MKKIFGFILLIAAFSACQVTYDDLLKSDIEEIEEYVEDNNLDAIKLESGVFVVIDEEGSAEKPDIESTVTVDYRGYYLDGDEFDSSYTKGEPLEAPLLNLIQGWQIGLQEFGRGGEGMVLIPSGLGYGVFPPGGIEQNAILIFDIELIDFE